MQAGHAGTKKRVFPQRGRDRDYRARWCWSPHEYVGDRPGSRLPPVCRSTHLNRRSPRQRRVIQPAVLPVRYRWPLLRVAAAQRRSAATNGCTWHFSLAYLLTGFGSAYYHLEPNNPTLVWDRLPMTIGFMSLFALIFAERIDDGLGRKLFPWLVAGFASVLYWHLADDLRPYLLMQRRCWRARACSSISPFRRRLYGLRSAFTCWRRL